MTDVPRIELADGHSMPILGFGVYQVPPEQTQEVVSHALQTGYRHLDTAAGYRNEAEVGRAVAASGVPREQVFLTTKMWIQQPDQDPAHAVESSLRALGVDYLDLLLIHQPYGDVHAQWRAMEAAVDDGRVRSIGVSNFAQDRLLDLILHTRRAPVVNQVECHPFHRRVADQAFFTAHGVQTESWGPLAEGRNGFFTHPVLSRIAGEVERSVAQVALRWLIQREIVVIPKSVRPERMAENLAVFDFQLDDEQMAAIAALDTGQSLFFDHRDPEWVERLGTVRVEHGEATA